MASRVICGNVTDVLPTLKPGSVDAVVTSPPYHMLRSYLPKGHPLKEHEIGSEPTVQEYVAKMVRVLALVREAMADHAVLFLNVGDTYNSDTQNNHSKGGFTTLAAQDTLNGIQPPEGEWAGHRQPMKGLANGNLCLVPQRLAIALQDDGWIVRSVICWTKPSPMPASLAGWSWRKCRVKVAGDLRIKNGDASGRRDGAYSEGRTEDWATTPSARWADCPGCPGCEKCRANNGLVLRKGSWRPTSAWEPVIMLAKTSRYYADGVPVQTAPAQATVERAEYGYGQAFRGQFVGSPVDERHQDGKQFGQGAFTSGANARDVQRWASEALSEAHYAAFPTALPLWCLRAGTSEKGYCPNEGCGMPWVRCIEAGPSHYGQLGKIGRDDVSWEEKAPGAGGNVRTANGTVPSLVGAETKTIGWRPSCNCIGADLLTPRPGLVLDPFAGSSRTGIAAQRLGLDFIGIDLNEEYCNLSRRILRDDSPLFSGGVRE